MIQLSLFPVRGFALLLGSPWNDLAVDDSGEPRVWRNKRAARRAYDRQPSWIRPVTRVVEVERHEAAVDRDLPTFVIL